MGSLLTYTPPEVLTAMPGAVNPLALSLNENPFPPLPAVHSALIGAVESANRYPDFLPHRLRDLVAEHVDVRPAQVVLGAGATGVVQQILQGVTTPGDRIILASPTFDGYPILADIAGLQTVSIPLDERGRQDLTAMADAASEARVVVLCRPHNPTGTLEPAADVIEFLRQVPGDTLVVLDEAYVEFVAPESRLDATALVDQFANLMVLRTFSKAYGLAGLRIGYGFAAPKLATALWAMQTPFAMNITCEVAVAASYAADEQLQQRVQMITDERRYVQQRLRAMGVHSTDTHANFVYLPATGRPWRDVFDRAGLRVRHYADGGMRVTIGSHASSRAVLAASAQAVEVGRHQMNKLCGPELG